MAEKSVEKLPKESLELIDFIKDNSAKFEKIDYPTFARCFHSSVQVKEKKNLERLHNDFVRTRAQNRDGIIRTIRDHYRSHSEGSSIVLVDGLTLHQCIDHLKDRKEQLKRAMDKEHAEVNEAVKKLKAFDSELGKAAAPTENLVSQLPPAQDLDKLIDILKH